MTRVGMLALGLAILVVVPAAADRRPPSAGCAHGHSRTVVESRATRVYRIGPYFVGCVRRTGRRTALGYAPIGRESDGGCWPDSCFIGAIRVAGRLVAFNDEQDTRFGLRSTVVVRNLARGVALRTIPTGTATRPEQAFCASSEDYGIGAVSDLVLTGDGRAAWIAQRDCTPSGYGPSYEVHEVSSAGKDRLLDVGPTIDPRSLAMHAGVLRWTDGAHRMHTPLA